MLSEKELTVNEDLMREHGVLNRILLIYERVIYLIGQNIPFDWRIIWVCAYLIRTFVEDFHEKFEEKYIFPALVEAGQHVELIDELIRQHNTSRELTDKIMVMSTDVSNITKVTKPIRLFVDMYRYHESREDTDIFPTFKNVVSVDRYKEIGEIMEENETQTFGDSGFESIFNIVKTLEKKLEIFDIGQETRKIENYLAQ